MPGQDQSETEADVDAAEQEQELEHDHDVVTIEEPSNKQPEVETQRVETKQDSRLDWLALGTILLISVIFAFAARLNLQPPTSLTPAAVLSATGCGLLVTAIRKLRTSHRTGIVEAGLGGVFLALCQFIAAITYPNVLYTLSQLPDERQGFLSTWGLIAIFTVVFSIVGAALGHLAFAPLRPLPARRNTLLVSRTGDGEGEANEDEEADRVNHSVHRVEEEPGQAVSPKRPLASYVVAALLFGLAPMVAGYVFSAAFDYTLGLNHFFGGPYPTLRLLSATLPWQVPIPINVSGNDPNTMLILLLQLWRIPVFLGNPTIFDFQALEPFVFNGTALALLLLTVRNQRHQDVHGTNLKGSFTPTSWPLYLLLEIILGLLLVAPADFWIVRGLLGVLQEPVIVLQIRTLYILDQRTFILNLVTGPLICLCIALLLRLPISIKLRQRRSHAPPG